MMRQTFSLIWKEYREQRWFLVAALVIFCGFPLIEATGRYYRPPKSLDGTTMKADFYSDAPAGLVLGLGGLLAILVAVGATTRDLRDELLIFWRSRPVGAGRWMAIKYLAGLSAVLTACTIPMLMQFWMVADTGRHWSAAEVGGTIGIHTFAVVLIFSVAFLLGCLVRHTTHAALLAMAAALVIYFLPVVVAPLAPLSVFNLMNSEAFSLQRNITPNAAGWNIDLPIPGRWRAVIEPVGWTRFTAAMVGGSIAATALALVAVRRDWRIEADRQAMHWSLGGVALVLFGATAFQVGSNLKVVRQFDFPKPNHAVVNLAFDGKQGAVLVRGQVDGWQEPVSLKVFRFEMTPDGLRTGPLLESAETMHPPAAWDPDVMFWRKEYPDRAYLFAQRHVYETKSGTMTVSMKSSQILTLDLSRTAGDPVVHRLDLMEATSGYYGAQAALHGDSIFVVTDNRTLAISLADPDAPALEKMMDHPHRRGQPSRLWFSGFVKSYDAAGRISTTINLPDLPGLTPRECLAVTLAVARSNERATFANDLLAVMNGDGAWIYRLSAIDAKSAHFELLGQREYTPLERLMGSYATSPTIIDGRLYTSEGRGGNGMAAYDVTDPARPRSAGHFATPNAHAVKVRRLLNGQLLVAGDRFYVLDPPKAVE